MNLERSFIKRGSRKEAIKDAVDKIDRVNEIEEIFIE